METRTIIESIGHEDLVDFLSTALYGSSWLSCDYSKDDYKLYCDVNERDCIEDKMAKLLLADKEIMIGDRYAEDETDTYGTTLPHEWDGHNYVMWYTVKLSDIKRGVQTCLDGKGKDGDEAYLRRCATDYVNGEGDMDLPEAEAIMQAILWDKLIYG